jgi:predicted nucleic acid-binding protein
MFATTFKVVLDACVLYPFTLRDTLLRAAHAGLYQVYWSHEILDETTRNLIKKGLMNQDQAEHLVEQMEKHFPEALVEGYEPLVEAMPNDPKDRHVAAAAVKAGAETIVTSNLKDFRQLPQGHEALSPDAFLTDLFDLSPDTLVEILRAQAAGMRRPPKTFEELLVGLAKTVPSFVQQVSSYLVDQEADEPPNERQ